MFLVWPVWGTRASRALLSPHNLGFLTIDRLAERQRHPRHPEGSKALARRGRDRRAAR